MTTLVRRLAPLPRGCSFIKTTTHAQTAGWSTNHAGEDISTSGSGETDTYTRCPMFSVPVKWAVWEDTSGSISGTQGATTTANLTNTFAYARTRTATRGGSGGARLSPYVVLLRIYAGMDGPFGANSGPSWGTSAGVPSVALASGNNPYIWDTTYRSILRTFFGLVSNWLNGLDASGIPRWRYVSVIPIMGPTGQGVASTEMWLKYYSSPGTVDNSNSSPDRLAWDAISIYPGSVSSQSDKELYRQRKIEAAYRTLIGDQLVAFPNNYHALAFGEVMNDSFAIAKGLINGRTVTTGSLQATSAGATTVNFNGSPALLTNGGIGASLYKTASGAHTLMGTVSDITSNTAVTLSSGSLVAASNTDTYSMELPPAPTGNGRLCGMFTNLEIDQQWRSHYFRSPDAAEALLAARGAGWPILLQTETWTGSTTGYDQQFSVNTNAAGRASMMHALTEYNPEIIEASGSEWSALKNWLSEYFSPLLQRGGTA